MVEVNEQATAGPVIGDGCANGDVVTFIVIVLDKIGLGEAQDKLEIKVQVTLSPLARDEVVYVEPLPTILPFTLH